MIILGIDTSGTGCFACVYDSLSDSMMGEAGADIGRGHAERLMDFIDEALHACGKSLSDIERVAVTVGPGSFTGIRVGVAVARGLALSLGVPTVGITTLAALAHEYAPQHGGEAFLVAIDAKRDEIYCQTFSGDGLVGSEPHIRSVEEACRLAGELGGRVTGSGTVHLGRTEMATDSFSIGTVARLGATADPASAPAKPLYLRGPDAKPQAGFAVSRV
ncbi:tRNA (adenosine(37)-N6)-threonylcarbamoyltransferase complex dimerization subunit type 1 TsaB [Sinorhizobium sp. BG8]|uniref:tRNA (adenosine(37)-N6)-threonylcarbamoyltransferase complex dimerization subunit type 1 TsaB n=1 Tax=Sinorhizobium sp. BG8 TaxID=2613773 RepID=UPI00193DADDD|nr:tRNA (adenosine(37)-N6)-threonylcarbamoyltransferase complex dimerization subunit type 1 TsaB [Sinorhizobium sp. BG8]QRM54028.1 tRNA (adenosine(37)-N6)-threonylcarbamoyltransferase complex dimerization subunit type 1 TsaB [Sinorhizobium sp. BG8]